MPSSNSSGTSTKVPPVVGLDLLNTELVFLSACKTGLGDVQAGEGVFGLRRTFAIAGARTLIMTLWKVSDLATAILVDHFYERLLDGTPKGKALRQAQPGHQVGVVTVRRTTRFVRVYDTTAPSCLPYSGLIVVSISRIHGASSSGAVLSRRCSSSQATSSGSPIATNARRSASSLITLFIPSRPGLTHPRCHPTSPLLPLSPDSWVHAIILRQRHLAVLYTAMGDYTRAAIFNTFTYLGMPYPGRASCACCMTNDGKWGNSCRK